MPFVTFSLTIRFDSFYLLSSLRIAVYLNWPLKILLTFFIFIFFFIFTRTLLYAFTLCFTITRHRWPRLPSCFNEFISYRQMLSVFSAHRFCIAARSNEVQCFFSLHICVAFEVAAAQGVRESTTRSSLHYIYTYMHIHVCVGVSLPAGLPLDCCRTLTFCSSLCCRALFFEWSFQLLASFSLLFISFSFSFGCTFIAVSGIFQCYRQRVHASFFCASVCREIKATATVAVGILISTWCNSSTERRWGWGDGNANAGGVVFQ